MFITAKNVETVPQTVSPVCMRHTFIYKKPGYKKFMELQGRWPPPLPPLDPPLSVRTINWDEWVVVDLFSHDTCKTANVIHRHISNNKTANIKEKNLKVYNGM